ncbi:MAG: glycoside hydrolase family 127 protein [Verrucomicrobia bacterium]|nr:glycoside hydrolase family 127 protein [Verrucomicrobiota bacterium]
MKDLTACFVLIVALAPLVARGGAAEASGRLELLPIGNVQVSDGFWAPRIQVYREKTIPHSWSYMEWELRSLRKAVGEPVEGELNGTWGEANLYKFLETVAYSLAIRRDPELEQRVDGIVDLLRACQQPNGYLHVYVTNNRKPPWDPAFLDGSHDGYVLGHMIEAAIEYHAATGKRDFLDIACKAADEACNHFLGPNAPPGFCGHAELEMALVKLYRVTGNSRYLELSRAFVEWRGRGLVPPAGPTPRAYFQDGVPLRAQRTLDGHAVRAVFFATGVADLAIETGDSDYRLAAHRFWDSTTLRRMTITGSIGPRKEHEAFGEDYELPNDGYYESCGACGLVDFAHRLFLLERRSESIDVLERVLYNAVLHGIALDGVTTYYCNPLSDRDHLRDNCWVCCPPNLSRTLLQVGRYAYARTDRDLFVNLFVGGTVRVPFPSGELLLRVETDYPWDGEVNVRVEGTPAGRFALHLRKPGWSDGAELLLNGVARKVAPGDAGYWTFEREWKNGDSIRLNLEMPVQRMMAHPNVVACRRKVALQRGPLVYGFEGLDNGGKADVTLGTDPRFTAVHQPGLLGGVTAIRGVAARGEPIQAVPFFAMANRGSSTQEVWVEQENLTVTGEWWLGALYRPMREERLSDPRRAEDGHQE